MSDNNDAPVLFTQRQYDYLNKNYPELTSNTKTNEELRFYMGQRSLVQFIGTRIQKGPPR
jgi:hypothetical protein